MKKLILGLMMAFAVTAEAEVIDGINYQFYSDWTATITGYDKGNPPTKIDVAEVERGGKKYTVTSVWTSAFQGCSSLASVDLPLATTVGPTAFNGCSSLASVSLPLATTVGANAFSNCKKLTSVSLLNATTIGANAFKDCSLLTSVSLLNATTIEANAFNGCSLLASVSLPSVTEIGQSAFPRSNVLSSLLVNVEMKSAIETNGRTYYGISSDTTITYYDGLPISVVKAAEYKMVLRSGDMPLDTDEYKRACEVFGITPKTEPQIVGEGEIAVKKESIAAPSAGTVKVEDNKVQLGVTVLKTSDLTAEKKEWGEVTLTADDVKVVDGKVVISVPVDSSSGFMVIQTKDAAK